MKQESWQLLKHLHSRHSVPWLCFGDFNEILQSEEKQSGLPKLLAPMLNFREALLYCGLVDLGYQGNIFTWTNERDDLVQERLDRECATIEWRDKFAQVQVTHLEASYSDHNLILVTTHIQPHPTLKKKIPHRFEERWATHPDCENIIQVAWNLIVPNGSPMAKLFEKKKRCRFALVNWSRLTFGLSRPQLQEKQKILEELCL